MKMVIVGLTIIVGLIIFPEFVPCMGTPPGGGNGTDPISNILFSMLPILLPIPIICGILVGKDAKKRGMSPWGWGIFVFAIWIIAIPMYVILRKPLLSESSGVPQISIPSSMDTKKCPYCAEIIRREAIKCRYCGSDVRTLVPNIEKKREAKSDAELIGDSMGKLEKSITGFDEIVTKVERRAK